VTPKPEPLPYFLLLEQEAPGQWVIAFGDPCRATVVAERRDRHESWPYPLLKNLKVLSSPSDRQADCQAAVDAWARAHGAKQ